MITPYAGRELGRYLRNALRSAASAELLKPVAEAASVVLGTTAPGGTAEELERAIETFPTSGACAEAFERNAHYADAEFALDEIEFDILLLALQARRSRQLARFGSAVQAVVGERPAWSRSCSDGISTRCGNVWRRARACASAG